MLTELTSCGMLVPKGVLCAMTARRGRAHFPMTFTGVATALDGSQLLPGTQRVRFLAREPFEGETCLGLITSFIIRCKQRAKKMVFGGRMDGVKIIYGLAEFDNYTQKVDGNSDLPMDRVQCGELHEFLRSAGDHAWELCGAFPAGLKGLKRAIPGEAEF